MQFLVLFTPKPQFATDGPPSDFKELHTKELARAKVLYGEGHLRQTWVMGEEKKGAACLFEADSPKHLQEMVDSFPLVEADYADTQIVPLAPDPVFAKRS